jgi:hypothetical protein
MTDTAEMRIARDDNGYYRVCPSKAPIILRHNMWRQDNKKGKQQAMFLCPYWVRKHFPSLRCMKPGAEPRRVRITMELLD